VIRIGAFLFLILALALGAPRAAHAAESYDNCTGFITSVPAVITTQGTWCLKQDLTTAITGGRAIYINASNVTIDCNDFKLGGLAAGLGTAAWGIYADTAINATVRHCNIRGFSRGIFLAGFSGSGGHTVEDNRLDGNTTRGIDVEGDGSVVRRNRVFDTGGSTLFPSVKGIFAVYSVDVLDNTVSGVTAHSHGDGSVGDGYAIGIQTSDNSGGSISGNRVRGVIPDGTGLAYGVWLFYSNHIALRNNDVVGTAIAGSIGLRCESATGHARDNVLIGFAIGIDTCSNDGGNVIAP
jgi:nitrous oxidase accessory protein NosD